ncbi:hypothetical protein PVAP13_9NG814100 [Panicum virgatum]|uniref:Uncharacterized protein n=1 Tax=Panicum virgatum TaxID=38727 RepID=A0A8T0N733_PANVG|nr:hypothetical protein PVAP13_9NG814100 [Panicum virgatum]
MNMPIHKLLLPSSGQSPEWTTQPGASPDLDRPDQSSSGLPGEHARHSPGPSRGRAIAALATRQVRRPAWFGGAKRWGRAASRAVLSRSGFAVRHVISSRGQPVAGMQASMLTDLQRGTAGRGVRAGDSHYTNRHKGLRRSKQGVEEVAADQDKPESILTLILIPPPPPPPLLFSFHSDVACWAADCFVSSIFAEQA